MVDVLASVGGRCSRAGENEGKVWPWKVGDSREQSVHRSYSPSHVDGRALTQPNGNSSILSSSIQKAPIFDMSKTLQIMLTLSPSFNKPGSIISCLASSQRCTLLGHTWLYLLGPLGSARHRRQAHDPSRSLSAPCHD